MCANIEKLSNIYVNSILQASSKLNDNDFRSSLLAS